MDWISVVIPCYRDATYLAEAIESVAAQDHRSMEIIVVDDGTRDDSVLQVAERYRDVRYVWQPNRGLSAARNRGLTESRGDYVLFLDADDRLLPSHFRTSLRAFKGRPEAALVSGAHRLFGPDGELDIHQDCQPSPDHYGRLLKRNFIGMVATALFRRQIIEQLGGYREEFKACEDYELFLRVAREYPIHCHHQLVAEYRRYHGQMSSDLALMLRSSIDALRLQRPYLRRRPEYAQAYRDGLRQWRLFYGEPLVWEMVQAGKAGNWRTAGRQLSVLIRYYPEGLVNLVKCKLESLRTGRRDRVKA
jgi:glycosyltransferase involved in cell wall biosynthesis